MVYEASQEQKIPLMNVEGCMFYPGFYKMKKDQESGVSGLLFDLITISSVLPFNFIFPCIAHAKATAEWNRL